MPTPSFGLPASDGSAVCEDAPNTPNPPALVTAATTSRQWLDDSNGKSIPSMSQIAVLTEWSLRNRQIGCGFGF